MTDPLIQLEDTADQWVTSFLGLQKNSKFVIEDDNVLLVNCPLLLLENINFKAPLGDAVLESLQAFHVKHGCGINSFLCLWCAWNKGIRCLLRESLPFSSILEAFTEGLNYVISSMNEQEISLQFALSSLYGCRRNQSIDVKTAATNRLFDVDQSSLKCSVDSVKSISEMTELPNKYSTSNVQQNRRLLYSYRLYNDGDDSFAENCDKRFYHKDSDEMITRVTKCLSIKSAVEDTILRREVTKLLNEISHGANFLVPLVAEVWQRQLKSNSAELFRFCKDKILTFPVAGYKFSYSTVIDGIVSKLSCISQGHPISNNPTIHRSLLIGGSITPNYVHLGFAPDVAIEKISSCVSENDDIIWLHQTVETLHKLNVSALLVEGTVDERLVATLQGSVIIISHISHSSMCKLAKSTSKNVISYVENSDEMNICNVVIEPLQLRKGLIDNEKLLVIKVPGKFVCQSVIICHELQYVAHQLEHTLWHFISRLSNICTAEKLLPGTGKTEKFCIRKLKELGEKIDENDICKIEALKLLSDGFDHYVNKIELVQAEACIQNDTTDDTGNCIMYDDPISKIEGWKAALKLALLLSQVDSVIVSSLAEASEQDLLFYHRTTL